MHDGSRLTVCEWMYFIFMPAVAFPILWISSAIIDYFLGDSNVYLRILFDSKGELLEEFLADFLASMPFTVAVCWLLLLPIYSFSLRKGVLKKKYHYYYGLIIWLVSGLWLYHLNAMGLVAILLDGSILITVLVLLKGSTLCGKRYS